MRTAITDNMPHAYSGSVRIPLNILQVDMILKIQSLRFNGVSDFVIVPNEEKNSLQLREKITNE